MRVDLHNLHDPRDFLAGTILVCQAQYTRESFELLNAGSKEINMNRGVQNAWKQQSLTLKVTGHKAEGRFFAAGTLKIEKIFQALFHFVEAWGEASKLTCIT